jgi:hypothetical protein
MKDDQKNHTRDEGGKEKRKTQQKKKNRRETIEDSLRIYIPGRMKVLKLACSTSTVRRDDTMMMMMMALTNHTKTNTK